MRGGLDEPKLRKSDVLIVADDITGALDTAGYFATPARPFKVWLGPPSSLSGSDAIDLDSRDLAEAVASDRVAGIFAGRKPDSATLSFKKIDSVMRGHPIAEAVGAFRAGRFKRALFAPAFPAMGRITVNGRQYADFPQGRTQFGPAFVDALSGHGVPAAMIGDARMEEGFLVADASSNAQLEAVVAEFGEGSDDLYVGTAGLAGVLAGGQPTSIRPPVLDLAICGTRHPVTLRQIAAVPWLDTFVMDGRNHQLPAPPNLLVSPPNCTSEVQARGMIVRSLEWLVANRPCPKTVLVTGGWTLRLLARICGASLLMCEGLYEPGVAMSRMVAGAWDGTVLVSKSGGFGGERFLAQLFAPGTKDSKHERAVGQ